jgi:pyridoxal phosphate-dependent aminotransferase EpsN
MGKNEKKLFSNAFDSNWIAPSGPSLNQFEKEMSHYLNINSCCALSSGTAALHLSLRILGIKKGDVVLCSSLTFAASANAILYEKAIPVFLDSDPNFWTIDPECIEKAIKKHKPKALIAVDIYGQSCDYDPILDLCEKYNIYLIQDSAESLGSDYKGKKCGTFGEMGILSFNGNKIITTSGGGMLVSNNKKFIDKAHYLSTQSREPKIHYEHKELGFNYRLSNLLAAIGTGQLESLDYFVKKRRSIYKKYHNELSHIDGFKFMELAEYGRSNCWLTAFTIESEKTGFDRDHLIKILENENIESRPVWKPMHLQPFYKKSKYVKNSSIDVSKELFLNGICLPSGSSLSEEDQDRIIDIILSLSTK